MKLQWQVSAKLTKDRDALLSFYDFPAERWKHVRTREAPRPRLNWVTGSIS